MVAVPADMPVTTPVLPIVATPELLLLHTPPALALLNVIVDASQTVVVPVIVPAFGNGLTVTTAVVLATPQLLVTV